MSDSEYQELEADFGDVIEILREGRLETPIERPSNAVWNAIATGLGDDVPTVLENVAHAPAMASADSHGDVVSLDSRRSLGKTFAVITAVAAALLLVAVPLSLALRGDDAQRTELAALGGFAGAGAAELEGRTLNVDLKGLVELEGATYDVWLLDLDGDDPKDPLWIGFAEADGTFAVPEGVDLNEFNVVDVSIEPDDGDPAHSGDSILRGELEEV